MRLSQGLTLQKTADEFGVHLNSVEQWRQRWNKLGLVGLYEGRHTGRPRKWTLEQQQVLGALAHSEGGSVGTLMREIAQCRDYAPISESTAKRYLKEMNFTYKRYRYGLKKRNQVALERAREVINALAKLENEQRCELLYFDESGLSPNPSVQHGWGRIGQTRAVARLAHRQRVNVLGALRHDGQLIWNTQQRPTTRDDVIAFFDQIALDSHSVPGIVLLDNADIHKGELMEKKRRQWAKYGLYLYYLPPYSPELNRIEILWKHAKHFWRRFVARNGADLLDEIQSLMRDFRSKFTINFA